MSDEPIAEGVTPELWKRISWAIDSTSIPWGEWNHTQASCHKKGCPCRAHWNGDPQAALDLVQSCVKEAIYDELHFQLVTEPNIESFRISPFVMKQISRQLEELKNS